MKYILRQTSTTSVFRRAVLVLIFAFVLVMQPAAQVYADSFDDQIKALQNEISNYQQEAGKLRTQADTLQNQINVLQTEKNSLQTQINLNEARLAKLRVDIQLSEQRLENQKALLGANLKTMYLESSVSPLEMLASSKSISDFVDKNEYRNKVRDQVQRNMEQVKKSKEDLTKQKAEAENRLADQKQQRSDLAAKETEQANVLSQTQGQEAAYQQLSKERNSKITELRAQQLAANQKKFGASKVIAGDPNKGGYPSYLYNAPQDSMGDPWGLYNRECVSYTAWKVHQTRGNMYYGFGDANMWPGNADRRGVARGSEPRAGAVAISLAGPYGHTMYVESVLDGGRNIYISQFNYGYTGEYSEMVVPAGGLIYLYF